MLYVMYALLDVCFIGGMLYWMNALLDECFIG